MKKEEYIEKSNALQQQLRELQEEYIKTNITYPVGTKVKVINNKGKTRIGVVTNNIIENNNVVPYVNMITQAGEVSKRRIVVWTADRIETIEE